MTIKNIYNKYWIPQNLREHMLRVGTLASIITENWTGEDIDRSAIVIAALLHDIAKPINFDLAKQAQFGMTPKEIANPSKHQSLLKKKFGDDEHSAVIRISQSLGCSKTTVRIIDNAEWKTLSMLMEDQDIESLIVIYCDMRIGLHGILSFSERLEELKTRSDE